jgi:hypothetical protein
VSHTLTWHCQQFTVKNNSLSRSINNSLCKQHQQQPHHHHHQHCVSFTFTCHSVWKITNFICSYCVCDNLQCTINTNVGIELVILNLHLIVFNLYLWHKSKSSYVYMVYIYKSSNSLSLLSILISLYMSSHSHSLFRTIFGS